MLERTTEFVPSLPSYVEPADRSTFLLTVGNSW